MALDTIVYDLETKESFADIGGRDPRRLHISLLGMYSYTEDRYYSFTEDELSQFWRRLESCGLLIGFSNKGFDDQVVSAYFPEVLKIPSFDILEEVYRALGFRVKLDSLAQATLGTKKSGSGLRALQLYAEGKIEELRAYCLDDVRITKEIYDFGRSNGYLRYTTFTGNRDVAVNFNRVLQPMETPLNLSLF